MTAEKIIEVVADIMRRDINLSHSLAESYRDDGDDEMESAYTREAYTMRRALLMLTDEQYRNNMDKILGR